MKKILLSVLILANISAAANTSTKAIAKTSETTSVDKDSQSNRKDLKYSIQYGGGLLLLSAATILEINYLKNSKRSFSLRYAKSDADQYDDEEQTALLAGMKLFSGNSFYVRPEAYYRDFQETVSPELFSSETRQRKVQDIGISISIGNEWQWENFTLGCDWIGAAYQVATLKDNGERDWLYSDDLEILQLSFFNLRLGYSF